MTGWTRERPAPGVVVWQPERGYRYGVEVYALATLALQGPHATVLDLGAGSGVVGLLLAARGARVVAVERETEWVAAMRRSAAESTVGIDIVEGDVREFRGERVDVVVANPPWFDPAAGPVAPDRLRAAARTAFNGGLAEFLAAGLRHADRVCAVARGESLPADCHVAVRARLGRHVRLIEVRPGEGQAEDVELPDVYAAFR